LLGDAYHGLIRQGIEESSIVPIDDIEARALMLPGLVSWLVKEDVPRDLAQQRHIAREVANLVALGLRPMSGFSLTPQYLHNTPADGTSGSHESSSRE
jgi:hypothetical protein